MICMGLSDDSVTKPAAFWGGVWLACRDAASAELVLRQSSTLAHQINFDGCSIGVGERGTWILTQMEEAEKSEGQMVAGMLER